MNRPDLLIFDLNGTIIDDAKEFFPIVNAMLNYYGLPEKGESELRERINHPLLQFFRDVGLDEEWAPSEEIFRLYRERYRALMPRLVPFPDAPSTLKTLRRRGVRLALVSAQYQEICEEILSQHGLTPYFKRDCSRANRTIFQHEKEFEIFGAMRDKAPALFALALGASLEINRPAYVAYVGDQTSDVEAAKAAGVTSVAFCCGVHTEDRLFAAKPDVIIHSLKELLDLFFPDNPFQSPFI